MATAVVLSGPVGATENPPKVVASIKPIHSLVATVMLGIGEPDLIIEGAGSPHTYALKPSQAAALENADLVFWVGHVMETFLEKPIESILRRGVSVELIDAPGVKTMEFREGGAFAAHDHDHRGSHDDEKEHGHEKEHEHDKAHAGEKERAHTDDHDDHAVDGHIWLDPMNAKALVGAIKDALVKADPAHRKTYEANAAAANGMLSALTREVTATLAPVKAHKFVVFHDGYQYFEKRFGVRAAGSITVSPEVMPGAARLGEIRARLKTLGATCVFAEPQFEPKLVSVVIEGTSARSSVIDPLGANLEPGPDQYMSLIKNMARSIRNCLSKPG